MVTALSSQEDCSGAAEQRPVSPAPGPARVGIYDTYLESLGGGENTLAVLAELIERKYPQAKVDLLTHEEVDDRIVDRLSERFNVSLTRTRVRRLPANRPARSRLTQPLARFRQEQEVSRASESYELFLNNTIFSVAPPKSRRSAYLCMFPLDPRPYWADYSTLSRLVSPAVTALRRRLFKKWIGRYDVIAANSVFTSSWVERYWGLPSVVLYPPVESAQKNEGGSKSRRIVSLGRFFSGSHNKKHDILVQAFQDLPDLHREGWELHLAGGVTQGVGTSQYLDHLRMLAEGGPIYFHFDMAKRDLEILLGTSALFWHATGHGEHEAKDPFRFEHFGLATVEAMAYGCVPLAYQAGGQTEIIEHGFNGVLWRETDELLSWTRRLARHESLRGSFAERALARSREFNRARFQRQAGELLAGLID